MYIYESTGRMNKIWNVSTEVDYILCLKRNVGRERREVKHIKVQQFCLTHLQNQSSLRLFSRMSRANEWNKGLVGRSRGEKEETRVGHEKIIKRRIIPHNKLDFSGTFIAFASTKRGCLGLWFIDKSGEVKKKGQKMLPRLFSNPIELPLAAMFLLLFLFFFLWWSILAEGKKERYK